MRSNSWLPLMLSMGLTACRCVTPTDLPEQDAGFLTGVACAETAECALGESCVDGHCERATVIEDAGVECTIDADCGPGRRCVPSTGRCIDIVIAEDGGTEDAGTVSVCSPGEMQTCGSSKLGECKLGISLCIE